MGTAGLEEGRTALGGSIELCFAGPRGCGL